MKSILVALIWLFLSPLVFILCGVYDLLDLSLPKPERTHAIKEWVSVLKNV